MNEIPFADRNFEEIILHEKSPSAGVEAWKTEGGNRTEMDINASSLHAISYQNKRYFFLGTTNVLEHGAHILPPFCQCTGG